MTLIKLLQGRTKQMGSLVQRVITSGSFPKQNGCTKSGLFWTSLLNLLSFHIFSSQDNKICAIKLAVLAKLKLFASEMEGRIKFKTILTA